MFYAIIRATEVRLDINPQNTRALAKIGVALHRKIDAAFNLGHPGFRFGLRDVHRKA
ncbi:MAG: proline racemase family protein [Alphaproteobacteria bacterium]|nr:proline racemase family protein [Alphaproteobacteria bacterium]